MNINHYHPKRSHHFHRTRFALSYFCALLPNDLSFGSLSFFFFFFNLSLSYISVLRPFSSTNKQTCRRRRTASSECWAPSLPLTSSRKSSTSPSRYTWSVYCLLQNVGFVSAADGGNERSVTYCTVLFSTRTLRIMCFWRKVRPSFCFLFISLFGPSFDLFFSAVVLNDSSRL